MRSMTNRKPGHSQVLEREVGQNGFTLLEVLVAMSLLSVGIVALVHSIRTSGDLGEYREVRLEVLSVLESRDGRAAPAGGSGPIDSSPRGVELQEEAQNWEVSDEDIWSGEAAATARTDSGSVGLRLRRIHRVVRWREGERLQLVAVEELVAMAPDSSRGSP